ncbi:MAG: phosphatase PAP2 family protein [Myxococcota bacterium]
MVSSSIASADTGSDEVASETPRFPDEASSSIEEVVELDPDPHRLEWHWKRAHPAEISASALMAVSAIALSRARTPEARWSRVNGFDEWFRDTIGLSGQAQRRIDIASDVFALSLVAYPALIDAAGVALILDKNKVVFAQLAAIQSQAFATTAVLTNGIKVAVRRERPFGEEIGCPDSPECTGGVNRSFISGHTAFAFTGAGLTCVTHRNLPLYGRVGDKLACGTTLTMASLTGIFRIMADKHWMTDVMAGAGIGLFSGWLMPWLLHFRHDTLGRTDGRAKALRHLAPYGSRGGVGIGATGQF